jgi:signal transduction histidine kinase
MTSTIEPPYGFPMAQRRTIELVDLALAPVLVAWFLFEVVLIPSVGPNKVLAVLIGVPICAGIALRRRHPVIVGWGTQLLLSATVDQVHLPFGPVTIGWWCALYGLSVWTSTRWFVASVVMVVLANGGTDLLHLTGSPGAQFGVVAAGVMLLVRLAVGGRDRQLRLAERERDIAAREAVVEERERIARELHDVIAHHVSTMVVQAGAERRMLNDDQAETRDVLGTIERVGRGALTEMRRMVAMLRQDPADDLVPQPTLGNVPELVRQMQAAGLPVTLVVAGEPTTLAEGIELSAYRIVQEALTNALKHAQGARAAVEIRYGADQLELVVRDDGRRGNASPVDGGGHGLVGIRERVAMYGGSIEAGPQQPAGFAVRVLLPVR